MKIGEAKPESKFDVLHGIWQQLSGDQRQRLIKWGKQLLSIEGTPRPATSETTVVQYDSEETIKKIVDQYNNERLHSALGYQTPATWYRGNPDEISSARRLKMSQARHRRKQINLGIRQPTLPLELKPIAN